MRSDMKSFVSNKLQKLPYSVSSFFQSLPAASTLFEHLENCPGDMAGKWVIRFCQAVDRPPPHFRSPTSYIRKNQFFIYSNLFYCKRFFNFVGKCLRKFPLKMTIISY